MRPSSSAASATCARRQAARPRLGQDRRRLPHRRRPHRAPAHQLPASSRRHAEAAGLRLRARSRADGADEMARRELRDRGGRSQAGCHHDALAGRVGRASTRPGRCAAAAARDHQDRRFPGAPAASRRRAAAVGHPRARPDARHRRPGVRSHACRPRRRCHAHHGAAPAGPSRARHRHGARQAVRSIDLRATDDRDWLRALAREAHVFVQGYRPGGLARRGFSPEALAEMRPGIVVVTLSAYGARVRGPAGAASTRWCRTRAASTSPRPRPPALPAPKELPAQALDHATGYLMAFGAMMALLRKAHEGGSWHVRVSLAQTGHWLVAASAAWRAALTCPEPTGADLGAGTRLTRPSAASPTSGMPRCCPRRPPSGRARP